MRFGVQYYPMHWPESRWESDFRLMRSAGVQLVRMGDLCWSYYEPAKGKLDFSSMERTIELAGNIGIKTMLCSCSRTPPPWLYRLRPGMLPVDVSGKTRHSDGRYAVAMAHSEFREEAERIDGALIRHFAGNEHIESWQLDNEIGCHTDCFCDRCLAAFHLYLERKYKTPAALNDSWGNHFWAFSIDRFDDVPRPCEHPQLKLEYRRFLSELNCEFAAWCAEKIRSLDPGKPITTNFQNLYMSHTDYHRMANEIDVNGMNHYPARTPELALDYYRAARGEMWILEQQTHLQTIDSPAGWMRLWAWMAIAHGASALIYFRWRQCRWGIEQFGDGILPHDGRPGRFFDEFARIGKELEAVSDLIEPTSPRSSVALIYSYESRWAVSAAGYASEIDPVAEAVGLHRELANRLSSVDAMDPREDLRAYKLVIAPRLWLVDEMVAQNLRSYVGGGGTLCLTAGSGVVDTFGKSFDTPSPGGLSDIAGVRSSDFAYADDLELSLASDRFEALDGLAGRLAADELHVEGAEVVATHASGWRTGQPAVTVSHFGKGRMVIVGLHLEAESLGGLVDWLIEVAGVRREFEQREDLSVYRRSCDAYDLLFVLNWMDEPRNFAGGEGWIDAFTGEVAKAAISVPASGMRLLKREGRT